MMDYIHSKTEKEMKLAQRCSLSFFSLNPNFVFYFKIILRRATSIHRKRI
jgi:hypothetical protein